MDRCRYLKPALNARRAVLHGAHRDVREELRADLLGHRGKSETSERYCEATEIATMASPGDKLTVLRTACASWDSREGYRGSNPSLSAKFTIFSMVYSLFSKKYPEKSTVSLGE
jgi:hypothetical protein